MRRLFLATAIVVGLSASAYADEVFAYETGTIQPAGPRQPTSGDFYLNIEGFSNGTFASYGVVRWDITQLKSDLDTMFPGGWSISNIQLRFHQSHASFSTDGDVAVFFTSDDSTNAKDPNSPLAYPFFDPNTSAEDLPIAENDPLVQYGFVDNISEPYDSYTIYITGDTGSRLALANDVLGDSTVTLVVMEDNDGSVAATYEGQSPLPDPNGAPTLIVTAIATGSNNPPIANAGTDQTITDSDQNHTENVMLDGSGSSDPDMGDSIVDYTWKEGAATLASGANATPTVALGLGEHVIELTVTDTNLATDTDTVIITINPGGTPPIADAGAPQDATDTDNSGDELVTLDGSGSFDSDGTIISYTWTEDGGVIGTGVMPMVTLSTGLHTIFLDIEDNAGNTARDATFVKVLPNNVIARYDFDTNLDGTMTQMPDPNTFTSPADGFQAYSRADSASVPFALLDDTGTADPNECSPFATDNDGVVMCAKQDWFFGAADVANLDNTFCDKGKVQFTFDITGYSDIAVSIDMGACGDFEAYDPNDPNGTPCDPNNPDALAFDKVTWTYSIDGGAEQPLFTSSVDENGTYTYVFFTGYSWFWNDPMYMNGNLLTNVMKTLTASVSGTGDELVLTLRVRQNGSEESYVFDDVIVTGGTGGEPCVGDIGGAGGCGVPDGTVDLTDLGCMLGDYGGSGVGDIGGPGGCSVPDGTTDLTDLGCLLGAYGPCP